MLFYMYSFILVKGTANICGLKITSKGSTVHDLLGLARIMCTYPVYKRTHSIYSHPCREISIRTWGEYKEFKEFAS